MYTWTTQAQLRKVFRDENPGLSFKRYKQGGELDYPVNTRCAFVDWIDYLNKSGAISDTLAERVTL
jgi:hypothetical protein